MDERKYARSVRHDERRNKDRFNVSGANNKEG